MSEWSQKPLGTLCSIKTGKKDVNEGSPNGAYPFFTCSRDVHASDSYSFDTDAILIAGNGVVGETKLYRGKFEAYQRTYVLSGFKEDLDFIYYVLKGSLTEALSKVVSGSTMPYIRKGDLERFPIPFPPLPEQKKIAHILSTVQRAIETQERIIQTTTELKKALMHKLFTEGLRNEPQKQTEIGLVPESWEVVKLGATQPKLLQVMRNGYTGQQTTEPREFRVSRIETISEGYIDQERVRFALNPTRDTIEKYRIRRGDILLSHINSDPHLGKTGIANDDAPDLLHGMNLLLVRANNDILNPWFLNHLFQWYRDKGIFVAICSRSVNQSSINQAKMRALDIPLPCKAEQDSIAKMLKLAEDKIVEHERKYVCLKDLFRALLRELMTAKMHVLT